MSDFLSNLIARSFTDAPVIQPRVPSLFEAAADEFLAEPQSSTSAPVSKFAPVRETVRTRSPADASDARLERHASKPSAPAAQGAPGINQRPQPTAHTARVRKLGTETEQVIVPVGSFHVEQKNTSDEQVQLEALSEPSRIRPRHRKGFSPVAQRSSISTPIIRVTIGRVEVRAIHPPAPTPKQAKPAPPKLSLEDYLHKREGGSR
jgi:hypothetical protein